ncbi:hypothetical protein [Kineococcus glutinatus]|uniref:Uncharacterized protein n=1 Tax=Kineococcus glutinatus TaxID=1070872 RepID=A0ABP9HF55_9ACTN
MLALFVCLSAGLLGGCLAVSVWLLRQRAPLRRWQIRRDQALAEAQMAALTRQALLAMRAEVQRQLSAQQRRR